MSWTPTPVECCENVRSKVYETRQGADGKLYRRRRCPCCGESYTTVETVFDGVIPRANPSRGKSERAANAVKALHIWTKSFSKKRPDKPGDQRDMATPHEVNRSIDDA